MEPLPTDPQLNLNLRYSRISYKRIYPTDILTPATDAHATATDTITDSKIAVTDHVGELTGERKDRSMRARYRFVSEPKVLKTRVPAWTLEGVSPLAAREQYYYIIDLEYGWLDFDKYRHHCNISLINSFDAI